MKKVGDLNIGEAHRTPLWIDKGKGLNVVFQFTAYGRIEKILQAAYKSQLDMCKIETAGGQYAYTRIRLIVKYPRRFIKELVDRNYMKAKYKQPDIIIDRMLAEMI